MPYQPPASDVSETIVIHNAATATGDGQIIDMRGYSRLSVQVAGTFVGTVTFEATVDKTNYLGINMRKWDQTNVGALTAPGAASLHSDQHAIRAFKARISAYTSGDITVTAIRQR